MNIFFFLIFTYYCNHFYLKFLIISIMHWSNKKILNCLLSKLSTLKSFGKFLPINLSSIILLVFYRKTYKIQNSFYRFFSQLHRNKIKLFPVFYFLAILEKMFFFSQEILFLAAYPIN